MITSAVQYVASPKPVFHYSDFASTVCVWNIETGECVFEDVSEKRLD